MKKSTTYLLATVLGLFTFTGITVAEEASADKQEIIAACTAESKGAIDVQDYISDCVKEKEEEIKEKAKQSSQSK